MTPPSILSFSPSAFFHARGAISSRCRLRQRVFTLVQSLEYFQHDWHYTCILHGNIFSFVLFQTWIVFISTLQMRQLSVSSTILKNVLNWLHVKMLEAFTAASLSYWLFFSFNTVHCTYNVGSYRGLAIVKTAKFFHPTSPYFVAYLQEVPITTQQLTDTEATLCLDDQNNSRVGIGLTIQRSHFKFDRPLHCLFRGTLHPPLLRPHHQRRGFIIDMHTS